MVDAEEATAADIRPLSRALANAFFDDPVVRFLAPERRFRERGEIFFASEVKQFLRRGRTVLTDRERRGAALWSPPGQWKVSVSELISSAPDLIRTFGPRTARALRALSAIERDHPKAPHWYLAFLGTDPQHQGHGVGGALITQVTQRCDQEGVGAYLESSKPENVPYYRRFGFDVTEELALPGGGPPIWRMWRDPVA